MRKSQTFKPEVIDGGKYRKIRQAIRLAIESGAAHVRASYIAETLRTHWTIGGILLSSGLTDTPGVENAGIISRLVRDFNRPDGFFYAVAKFRRLYPVLPVTGLSWSHYVLLISVNDPLRRARLEKTAVRKNVSNKDLRVLIRLNNNGVLPVENTRGAIPVIRGRLYCYRVLREDPSGLSVLVDVGFNIDRELKGPVAASLHSGHMVNAVKEAEEYSLKISTFDKTRLYTYNAVILNVVDGDTFMARIDLGFRVWVTQKLRLRAVDAPEITSAKGRYAAQYVRKVLKSCHGVIVKTYKEEKFGRYLCDLFYKPKEQDPEVVVREGVFLNQELLDKKLAARYEG